MVVQVKSIDEVEGLAYPEGMKILSIPGQNTLEEPDAIFGQKVRVCAMVTPEVCLTLERVY